MEERLEVILLDLQQNYPQHQRRVEDYLAAAPELASEHDCLIRIILAEFTSRTSAGVPASAGRLSTLWKTNRLKAIHQRWCPGFSRSALVDQCFVPGPPMHYNVGYCPVGRALRVLHPRIPRPCPISTNS